MGDPVTPTGMAAVVAKLLEVLTPDKFFSIITELMPLVAMLVPVALGLYFLRKLVKGAGQAKVRF